MISASIKIDQYKIVVSFLLIILFSTVFLTKTKITYVSKVGTSNSSAIVSILNPPSTSEKMLDFWYDNKETIMEKIGHQKLGDTILFVKDDFQERSEDEEEKVLQICMIGKNDKPCVLGADRLMIVEKEKIDDSEQTTISFMDYYLKDNGHICLLYERHDGYRESIKC